jgi:hypothetical protein
MPFDNVGMAFVYLTWNLVIAWNAAVAFLSADAFPEDTDQKSEVRRDPPHSGGAWTIVRPKRRGVERSVDETVKLGPRTSTARARGNTGTKDRCTAGEATSARTPNKAKLNGNHV